MFFMLPKNTAKQLQLRDPSGSRAPMPKLVFVKKKILLNAQTFSLSLYLGYEPIYWQRGRCQPELGFLLLDLGVLSKFYLDFDHLLDI
jgi:hypothetical protein